MKTRAFIAGVAALLMATSAAHATVRLPDVMLGDWCQDESKSDDVRTVYTRDEKRCINSEENITVRRDGLDDMWSTCTFDKAERTGDVYLVYTNCKGNEETSGPDGDYSMQEELELDTNGQLIVTKVSGL